MADEELFDFPNEIDSNIRQLLEADLQIIYSRYYRAFDGAEEILLSAYLDKDDTYWSFSTDQTLEKLLVTDHEDNSCDSESDDDSDTSGPTRRANTTQDSLSELESRDGGCDATNLCNELDNLDCNEDFPVPVAESTRSDLTSEALCTMQNAHESGKSQPMPTGSRISSKKEEDSGFAKSAQAANCFPSSEFVNNTQEFANPALHQNSQNSDESQCKDIVSGRRMLNDKEGIRSTSGKNDLAAVVIQSRNRIASALAEIHQLDSQGNCFNGRKNRKVFSLRWTPSSSKKSIKLLSGDNGCDIPLVPRPLSPDCLKERIVVRSKVSIATDPKSGLLKVSCRPKSSKLCQDEDRSMRKRSMKLSTNRTLKSPEYGQPKSQVERTLALNRPEESLSANSVKLPRTARLTSSERCTHKSNKDKMSPSTSEAALVSTSSDLGPSKMVMYETDSLKLTRADSTSEKNGRDIVATEDTVNTDRTQKMNTIGSKTAEIRNGRNRRSQEMNRKSVEMATAVANNEPKRNGVASSRDLFNLDGVAAQFDVEFPREQMEYAQSQTSSSDNKIFPFCNSDDARQKRRTRRQLKAQKIHTSRQTEDSSRKSVTLITKDLKERAKTTSSVRLSTVKDLGKTSRGTQSQKICLTSDNKLNVVDSGKLTAGSVRGCEVEKMSGATVRPFPLTHWKTGCAFREVSSRSKNTHRRKRTADDDISDSVYGKPKKICRSGDKLMSIPKDTNNAASQLQCKGPGQCIKPFCFQCAHTLSEI